MEMFKAQNCSCCYCCWVVRVLLLLLLCFLLVFEWVGNWKTKNKIFKRKTTNRLSCADPNILMDVHMHIPCTYVCMNVCTKVCMDGCVGTLYKECIDKSYEDYLTMNRCMLCISQMCIIQRVFLSALPWALLKSVVEYKLEYVQVEPVITGYRLYRYSLQRFIWTLSCVIDICFGEVLIRVHNWIEKLFKLNKSSISIS